MRQFSHLRFFIFLLILSITVNPLMAQQKEETFTVENYYKVKWGYAGELLICGKKIIIPC